MRLVAFCEAAADFRIAADLVDRVLRELGPSWVSDVMDAEAEGIRSWHGHAEHGQPFYVIRDLTKHMARQGARALHGHFDGRPGAVDIMTGRNAIAIVRALVRCGTCVDTVLLIRDMDDRPDRRIGLEQARAEARSSFAIVLGCADPKREAWVLCGFDAEGDAERGTLDELRRELGFHPHTDAHQLDAADEQAKRNAKRVLGLLVGDDFDREARCWQHTPLETLRTRGERTGLRAFLDELEHQLIPLLRRT